MTEPIRVGVLGARGRMGQQVCQAVVAADDMDLVAAVDAGDWLFSVADGGAQVLVVQTNNATYNLTGQPDQQMAISRLRAVEYGRTVLVAATSGISAIIGPDGTVQARSRQLTPATLVARVPLRTARTVAATTEPAVEWVLAGIGLLAAVAGALAARAERRP